MSPIIPIIMLIITILGGGGYLVYTKISKKPTTTINPQQQTANEFINVKDIKGKFLYTRDGMALCYLKVNPISIVLFSKTEKSLITPKFMLKIFCWKVSDGGMRCLLLDLRGCM